MPLQHSSNVRNAQLDAIETTIGTGPLLRIFTGSAPANCAAASTGTLLVTMTLPSNWLADAGSGAKALAGSWSGTGVAGGTAGYFRIFNTAGSTCHQQGTCGIASGDLQLDNTSIAVDQVVNVTGYTLTAGNA